MKSIIKLTAIFCMSVVPLGGCKKAEDTNGITKSGG